MRQVWPSCPLGGAAEARIEVHGKVPRLELTAHAAVGAGKVEVTGPVDLGAAASAAGSPGTASVRAALHVEAHAIDLRAFAASAPPSDLAASGDLALSAEPTGAFGARGTIAFHGGDVGPNRVPAATVNVDATVPPGGAPTVHADGVVFEPGVPAAVTVNVVPRGKSAVLSFEAEARATHLEQVTRLGGIAGGSAQVRSTGSVDFGTGVVSGRLSATVDDLVARSTSLAVAHADARVGGSLAAPVIDVDLAGESLEAGSTQLAAVRATGRVALGAETTIRNVDVAAEGEGIETRVTAKLVRFAAGSVRVDEAVAEGVGAPLTGSLQVSSSGVAVHAKSAGLDLARLGRLAALPITAGIARLDVDATIASGSADGHVAIDVTHAALYGVRDANASVDATVHGRRVSGKASVHVEDIGTLEARSSALEVGPGRLLTASPWRTTWGALAFEGHVDLTKLAARLPAGLLPAEQVLGTLDLRGQVARDSADDATPGVDFTLQTAGLQVAGRRTTGTWRLAGIDPTVHVTVDGKTGETALTADLVEHGDPKDGGGTMVHLDASSGAVPYADIFSDTNPLAALKQTPFDAVVDVAPRSLDALPPAVRPAGLTGRLDAHAKWHGTIVAPSLDATIRIAEASDPIVLALPIDIECGVRYDGVHLDANLAGTMKKTQVLQAAATVEARAADWLEGSGAPWTASARATLNHMSLRTLAALYDRQVRGTVSGDIVLDGLRRDAGAHADLTFDGLQVNNVAFKGGALHLAADGHSIDGAVRFDQTDGFLESKVHAASRWGTDLAPSIDAAQPGFASLVAKNFRAAFFFPFAPSSLTELDGRIDADARVDVDAGSGGAHPRGTIAIRDGVFELATFGTEFHDVGAKLSMDPDGVLRLEQAVAHGLTGTVQAAATARLDGAGLVGARLDVRMPSKDPLPLVFDGVPMGALDGQFTIGVDRAGPGLDVKVDVPNAHVELPTASSSRDAQSLGDVPGVEIGIRSAGEPFAPIFLDQAREQALDRGAARKAPVHIAVKLGRDVRVSRGADLDIHLEGQPSVVMTDETRVAGQIRLRPGGTLDVQGKLFEIESGAVTFVGPDASDPQVVLTAGWTAPDGTRIYADYIGPLKAAAVKLRSSPAKTQNEILALLLYGSSDDATAQQASANANGTTADSTLVASAAGGAATQQLNQALGGVNRALDNLGLGGGISTKIDTSQVNPRPEVEVQIARDISLQVAWVLGAPPPTQPDSTLLTLDWRFLRKWSLETTIGDQGTSILNVVWQHRY